MNLSYWEYKTWLSQIDFTIVGSGIVGLSCALQLRENHPKAKILILERGRLPQGASTKNAGFACFGSISEILADLKHHSEEEVRTLVQERYNGFQGLRRNLGDAAIGFQQYGGHELFLSNHHKLYQNCLNQLDYVNALLQPVFGKKPFQTQANRFNFKNIHENYISHRFEGQINTGKMMSSLLRQVQQNEIQILNAISVEEFVENGTSVKVKTDQFEFNTNKLFIATNGFANELLQEDVHPARAQVLITKPIRELTIKGTFHFDEGYYYFRNVENRILFGGGRNLDVKGEATSQFGNTARIQKDLERKLKEVILPHTPFEIERRWSGIMGVGIQKKPVVKQISNHVFCGIRLGGMGIAIGSWVGERLAHLLQK